MSAVCLATNPSTPFFHGKHLRILQNEDIYEILNLTRPLVYWRWRGRRKLLIRKNLNLG